MNDIFKLFERTSVEDYSFIDSLSEDEIKKIGVYTLTMWAHGATKNNMVHTVLTDAHFNEYVFSLSKHPRLLLKLWMFANSGDNTKYKFVKSVTNEQTKLYRMIARHYNCGIREAKEIVHLLSEDDIKELNTIYEEKEH